MKSSDVDPKKGGEQKEEDEKEEEDLEEDYDSKEDAVLEKFRKFSEEKAGGGSKTRRICG